jgi:hypothetical protein
MIMVPVVEQVKIMLLKAITGFEKKSDPDKKGFESITLDRLPKRVPVSGMVVKC